MRRWRRPRPLSPAGSQASAPIIEGVDRLSADGCGASAVQPDLTPSFRRRCASPTPRVVDTRGWGFNRIYADRCWWVPTARLDVTTHDAGPENESVTGVAVSGDGSCTIEVHLPVATVPRRPGGMGGDTAWTPVPGRSRARPLRLAGRPFGPAVDKFPFTDGRGCRMECRLLLAMVLLCVAPLRAGENRSAPTSLRTPPPARRWSGTNCT